MKSFFLLKMLRRAVLRQKLWGLLFSQKPILSMSCMTMFVMQYDAILKRDKNPKSFGFILFTKRF